MTNHPVHIQDEDGTLLPTALIPFCEFGGNLSAMGVKIDQMDVPICNSFRPIIMKDQLCYTVDLNKGKLQKTNFIFIYLFKEFQSINIFFDALQ